MLEEANKSSTFEQNEKPINTEINEKTNINDNFSLNPQRREKSNIVDLRDACELKNSETDEGLEAMKGEYASVI